MQIIIPILSVLMLLAPTSFAQAEENKPPRFEYQIIAYSQTHRLLLRQITDAKLHLFTFQECWLEPAANGPYEGLDIRNCALLSRAWVQSNSLSLEQFNSHFTSNLVAILATNEQMDQIGETIAPFVATISGVAAYGFRSLHQKIPIGVKSQFGSAAVVTGAIAIFSGIASVVSWSHDFPTSIETTLQRQHPNVETELMSLGVTPSQFASSILSTLANALRQTLRERGFEPQV